MNLDNIIKLLKPKDKFYFDSLERSSSNLVEAALEFKKFAKAKKGEAFEELTRKIKDLEHEGDKITYKIFEELNKTFLTPLDREDIRELASGLDDVLDIIDSIAARIILYKIKEMTPQMQDMLDVVLQSVEQLDEAIKKLRDIHGAKDIHQTFYRIHQLEEDGDRLYHKSIAELFENEKDPLTLLKLKEIYEALERTIDRCKVTGDTIETVFMKNS